mmetsp:Transcript_109518/g.353455  ORF Transcript_109518/g.353455 Transcript_109518/m.353455 type:complete len:203 (+) Transcript_109518:394-1002(+)
MVELGVPVVRFGDPPEKGAPAFPGVSSTAFTPSGQLCVYRDILRKERAGRGDAALLAPAPPRGPGGDPAERLGDILPGYRSLGAAYSRLGFTAHPMTGRPVRPDYGALFPSKARRGPGSRAGSSLSRSDPGPLPPLRHGRSELGVPSVLSVGSWFSAAEAAPASRAGSAVTSVAPSAASGHRQSPAGVAPRPLPKSTSAPSL